MPCEIEPRSGQLSVVDHNALEYIEKERRHAGSLMVIGAESRIVEQSSNSGWFCWNHFCINALTKSMNPSPHSPAMVSASLGEWQLWIHSSGKGNEKSICCFSQEFMESHR